MFFSEKYFLFIPVKKIGGSQLCEKGNQKIVIYAKKLLNLIHFLLGFNIYIGFTGFFFQSGRVEDREYIGNLLKKLYTFQNYLFILKFGKNSYKTMCYFTKKKTVRFFYYSLREWRFLASWRTQLRLPLYPPSLPYGTEGFEAVNSIVSHYAESLSDSRGNFFPVWR